MSRILTVINYIMALLFVFAAAMQYNDPDGLRWIAIYASSVIACLAWSFDKNHRWISGLIFLVCLLWMVSIIFDVQDLAFNTADLVSSLEMKSESIEQFREIGGLIIVAAWMGVLFFKRNTVEKDLTSV